MQPNIKARFGIVGRASVALFGTETIKINTLAVVNNPYTLLHDWSRMRMEAEGGQNERGRHGEANDNPNHDEIGLREGFLGGMGRTADGPNDQHDQVDQGNRQQDEGENPFSN
jgi:hypothetical protein